MTLTECKEFMRLYQRVAEGEQYNWRTTARWALRHQWEREENGRLRDALRRMTERAEDRASEADACHEIMAECRKIAGDPHAGTIDAVRGLLARAEKAEAALATMIEQKEYFRQCWEVAEFKLAERDKPCVCGVIHHGMILHGNRYCPNCGHPIEVAE